jgi:hypothetical protein
MAVRIKSQSGFVRTPAAWVAAVVALSICAHDANGALASAAPADSQFAADATHGGRAPLAQVWPADTSRASYAVIASGSVQSAISNPGTGQPATGSLGIQHRILKSLSSDAHSLEHHNWWEQRALFLFSAATSGDTIRLDDPGNVAAAILAPGAGKPGVASYVGASYESLWEYSPYSHQQRGFYAYLTHSRGTWRRDSTAGTETIVQVAREAITSFGFGIEWVALKVPPAESPTADDNSLAVSIGVGYAGRFLHSTGANAAAVRRLSLGTPSTRFQGVEFTGRFQIRALSAVATIPILSGSGHPSIDGLTGPQLSVEFKLEAPIIELKTLALPPHCDRTEAKAQREAARGQKAAETNQPAAPRK